MAEAALGIGVLDALVVVARRHGVDTTAESVRRRFVVQDGPIGNAALISLASEIGLQARALRVGWNDLPRFANVLPAILRLKDGAALVLEAVVDDPNVGRAAVVSDPSADADTRALVDELQLSRVWDGELILVKRRFDRTDETQPFGLGWLLGQVLRERTILRDIAIGSLMSTLFAITPPFIAMIVLDRVIVNQSTSTLYVLAGVLVMVIAFDCILGFLRRLFMETAATRIDGRLNLYVMDRLLRLPMEYFERTPAGETMGKISKISQIRGFITGPLLSTSLDMITLVVLVPVLLILKWQLALMVFGCAGLIFLIIYVFLKPISRAYSKVIAAEIDRGSHLYETVQGMRTVKSLALEGRRRKEWDRKVAAAVDARYALGALSNYPQTYVMPLERMIYSGSIIVGAALALAHPDSMPPGVIMGFSMLAGRTAAPLVQLARLMQELQEVRGAVDQVASVMKFRRKRIARARACACRFTARSRSRACGSATPPARSWRWRTSASTSRPEPSSASWGAAVRARRRSRACCRG